MSKSRIIILGGFASILLLVTMLIAVGVSTLSKSKSHLDRVVNSNNRKIQLVNKMHKSARERTISLQHMFIVSDVDDREKSISRLAFYGGEFVAARGELLKLGLSEKEQAILKEQAKLSRLVGPTQNSIADMLEFGELEKAKKALLEKAVPLQDKVFETLTKLQAIQRSETKAPIWRNG